MGSRFDRDARSRTDSTNPRARRFRLRFAVGFALPIQAFQTKWHISWTTPDDSAAVLADLGDKILNGIAAAVRDTRRDLAEYRDMRPAWVAEYSERGLANWIHDRMWVHLQRQLEHLSECAFVNDEPERRFRVANRYHFRAKRHDEYGSIATYPTQGTLEFMEQQLTPMAWKRCGCFSATSGTATSVRSTTL